MDEDVEDFLEHFGVKGMKWGVRNERTPGVPRNTDRDARKDAEESGRAKMFYGKGAGTRRKLINESVAAKSKRDPLYATAFEAHMLRQDMSQHANKAVTERTRQDRKEVNTKRAGYVARQLTGEMGTQAAFMAVAVGGFAYLNSPAGRAKMAKTVSMAKKAVENQKNSDLVNYLNDFLNG